MRRLFALALIGLLVVAGCRSTYYATMEKFGKHKRDLLVDRVEAAREDQEDAKQQFRTALERFGDVVRLKDSDLKNKYDTLKSELDRSESKVAVVTERIASIEKVSEDLFDEWEAELKQYSSPELKRSSERQLDQTRDRYARMMTAMKRAEKSMEPVLASFRDRVLFLKHNLNAQAVASLQGELDSLENDTAALIREMESAIAEAEAFIRQMRAGT
jgi:hypothetical protein